MVLVDQCPQYIGAAPAFIGSYDSERVTYLCMVGSLYVALDLNYYRQRYFLMMIVVVMILTSLQSSQGLQDFIPEEDLFDLMWIQWVIGYLTDVDLVKFLRRCRAGLKSGGFIVIKDNMFDGFALVCSCIMLVFFNIVGCCCYQKTVLMVFFQCRDHPSKLVEKRKCWG